MDKQNIVSRREFLKAAGVTGASLAAAGCSIESFFHPTASNSKLKGRPNVLVIKSDEHNPFISSVEKHPFVKTPNMQHMADNGTYYKSHYCPSPLSQPSRSAYQAGKRAHEIQVYNNCGIFHFDYPSYGQVLREQGVYTVHIGKVDSYQAAEKLGFSEMHRLNWDSVRDPGDLNFGRKPLTVRPLENYQGIPRHTLYGLKKDAYKKDEPSFALAKEWIKTKGTSLDKPWVMEINTSKPHFPMQSTKEFWDMYEGHDDLPEHDKYAESAQHPFSKDLRAHFQTDKFPESSIRGLRRGYYANVSYLDRKIGEVIDVLKENGLLENTIIVYTSDHGEMLGKFGMWWKSSLYDDSARVPCIVCGPGFDKGIVDNTAVDQFDLLASIFHAVGAKLPEDWSGDAMQTLEQNDDKHTAFCEYHGHGVRASGYVLRRGRWKYIYNCDAPNQLFDIETDPQETKDVIAKHPNLAKDLHQDLLKYCDPEVENQRTEAFIAKQFEAVKNDPDLEFLDGGHAVRKGATMH
ncbi:sulfatase-like hydrolase/transferase [Planctomycetota bacterium]|nr:sulfatase-like hydrolase/transferase [Planctomycetota bacterium]